MNAEQILWPFIAGAAGWFALEVFGRPIRQFVDLRGEVIQQMTNFANVRARWKEIRDDVGATSGEVEDMGLSENEKARLEEAQRTFRDLASRMRAFSQNELLAVWAVKSLGYDPTKASAGLIGLSNALDTYGSNRAFQTKTVETALGIRQASK